VTAFMLGQRLHIWLLAVVSLALETIKRIQLRLTIEILGYHPSAPGIAVIIWKIARFRDGNHIPEGLRYGLLARDSIGQSATYFQSFRLRLKFRGLLSGAPPASCRNSPGNVGLSPLLQSAGFCNSIAFQAINIAVQAVKSGLLRVRRVSPPPLRAPALFFLTGSASEVGMREVNLPRIKRYQRAIHAAQ
jgi:hypothetical protein